MRKRYISANYHFFYNDGSYAAKAIQDIVSLQEDCFKSICRELRVKPAQPIRYYLCDTSQELGHLYGDNIDANGCTKMPDKVFAVYNENVCCLGFHEDAHIISYITIGRPSQKLLREGLAMYFDQLWWGLPIALWAKRWLLDTSQCSISDLDSNSTFDDAGEVVSYPLAGVLTQRLILLGGIEKYKQLYANATNDLDGIIRDMYGQTIDGIQQDIVALLRPLRFDSCLEERADQLVTKQKMPIGIKG